MSFEIGSFVEWKHVKGYIRFVSEDYISICVNVQSESYLDCCVVCHNTFWNEVNVIREVPPIFPITNPARSMR